MAHGQLNVSRGKLFAALLIAAAALQLAPHRYTQRLNFFFLGVFRPVLNIGLPGFSRIFRPSPSTEEFVSRSEHDELWKAYNNTHGQLLQMQQEYEKLALVRGGLPKPGPGLVLARITIPAISSFAHEVIINKGADDGLEVGQLVLCRSQSSVIGSVSEVRDGAATVQLLTDSRHTLMVAVSRDGKQEPMINRQMRGDGKDACKIPMVSREYDLRVGDTVSASPERGILDTPIVVGEVAAVEHDQDQPLLWDITVRPIFDREALTEVVVIVMNPKETESP